jgi:REP element-mobilizing transposase RayT
MMAYAMHMAPWQERHKIRLQEYDYNTPGAYFLTLCVENRKCVLSRIVGTGILDGPSIELLPYGKIAAKYINQLNDYYDNLSVECYVIMPNHIHILLRVLEGPSRMPVPTIQNSVVSRFVSTFKRFCNKEYGQNIWQSRSYDHVIRDQADFDKHLQYIYKNPYGWTKDELFVDE